MEQELKKISEIVDRTMQAAEQLKKSSTRGDFAVFNSAL
jgi:hypothetical protein